MDIYFNEEHPQNAPSPILVTLSGIAILFKEQQSQNALSPMLFTLLGMAMLDKEVQPANALLPMLVTLLGMIYDFTALFLKEIILLLSLLNKTSSS